VTLWPGRHRGLSVGPERGPERRVGRRDLSGKAGGESCRDSRQARRTGIDLAADRGPGRLLAERVFVGGQGDQLGQVDVPGGQPRVQRARVVRQVTDGRALIPDAVADAGLLGDAVDQSPCVRGCARN
jgi:hypothetical protein